MDKVHVLESPHMFNKKQKKKKATQLFKYKLPWQSNHQIVSDVTKKSIFNAKYLPETNGQIDYFCTYYLASYNGLLT